MRMQTTAIATLLGLSLAATIPLAAQAQAGRHQRQRYYEQPYTYVVPTQICQKMCAEDFSPCDPTYFKVADGRCAGIHPGR